MKNIENKGKNNKKICSFYASDYHFEMIILQNIKEELKENKKFFIFTENDLKESIKKIVDNSNFNEEEKEKIYDIGWETNDKEKFEKINKCFENNSKIKVFIKGNQKYTNIIEENIFKDKDIDNIEIIYCYNINEVGNDINKIINKYDSILNMTGRIKI